MQQRVRPGVQVPKSSYLESTAESFQLLTPPSPPWMFFDSRFLKEQRVGMLGNEVAVVRIFGGRGECSGVNEVTG